MSHSSKAEMSPPCLNRKLREAIFGLGDDERTRFEACRGVSRSLVWWTKSYQMPIERQDPANSMVPQSRPAMPQSVRLRAAGVWQYWPTVPFVRRR